MAVGDPINGTSADNTDLIFRPAVGVSVMITHFGTDNVNTNPLLTDGVFDTFISVLTGGVNNYMQCKIMINNTLYLKCFALGAGNYANYSGIVLQ
tara:strand:+ start:381 stop:665 length:285 start_codon:yes stop_codon:yes gene_type:complete